MVYSGRGMMRQGTVAGAMKAAMHLLEPGAAGSERQSRGREGGKLEGSGQAEPPLTHWEARPLFDQRRTASSDREHADSARTGQGQVPDTRGELMLATTGVLVSGAELDSNPGYPALHAGAHTDGGGGRTPVRYGLVLSNS